MSRMILVLLGLIAFCFYSAAAEAQDSEDPYANVPMSRTADGAFVLGDPNAEVKLIEFADFLCTSCQNYKPVISGFLAQYVATGRAQFEFRMFPVVDPVLSPLSASLVECAAALSDHSFWRAHDAMYDMVITDGFTLQSSATFAQMLDLEESDLLQCAAEARQVAIDQAYGFDLGVSGTPSIFVQFGDAEPIALALALPDQYETIVNANRPSHDEPVIIESGPYAGITTFRRADGGFVLGSPDAPITIVAFEDFLCPHCQNYQSTVRDFINGYVRSGEAQFEYRFYPLVNPQFSVASAQIAECVGYLDPRLFWDAHDLLYEFAAAGVLGDDAANSLANLIAIDIDELNACRSGAMQYLIDSGLGQEAGVSGTPAVRARQDAGRPQLIFVGQQPIDRGGAPSDVLSALVQGVPEVSIGEPEISLLNNLMLQDTSLITGEPCEGPCWRNITPGETNMQEALETLGALEGLSIIHVDDHNIMFAGSSGQPCCQIISYSDNVVGAVLLQFAPRIQLDDVLEAYGEPTYVTGQPFSEAESMLVMIYPESAMLVYVMVAADDGLLDGTSPVVAALVMTQSEVDNMVASMPLDDWKGLLSYEEYMDGEFDNSP